MAAPVQFEGFKELERRLEAIGDPKHVVRIERLGVNAGGRVIRDAVKANLEAGDHVVTRNLHKSIAVKSKTYRREVPVAIVGNHYLTAPHAHLVEFGTVERFHKPKGALGLAKSVGIMPAFGFFRRAWSQKADAAFDKMTDKIDRELDKHVARQAAA